MQIMMALDSDQKSELDNIMRDLEEENKFVRLFSISTQLNIEQWLKYAKVFLHLCIA